MAITRKEIRRFNKSELLKLLKEKGQVVSKKMTKNALVDIIMKNKTIRGSLTAPPKRKATPAQLKTQQAFKDRLTKKTGITKAEADAVVPKAVKAPPKQSKKVIQPTASNQLQPINPSNVEKPSERPGVEKKLDITAPKMKVSTDNNPREKSQIKGMITIIEQEQHKDNVGKLVVTDYKNAEKIKSKAEQDATKLKREYTAPLNVTRSSRTHISELRARLGLNKKNGNAFLLLDLVSNSKISDNLERKIKNSVTLSSKKLFNESVLKSERRGEKRFGELEELEIEIQKQPENPLKKIIDLLLLRQKNNQEKKSNPKPEEKEKEGEGEGETTTVEGATIAVKEEVEEIGEEDPGIIGNQKEVLGLIVNSRLRAVDIRRLLQLKDIEITGNSKKSLLKQLIDNSSISELQTTINQFKQIRTETNKKEPQRAPIVQEGSQLSTDLEKEFQ